jgi:hypothetical protein
MSGESGIMDDAVTTGINSMVPISAPEHDEKTSGDTLATQVRRKHISLPE